MEKSGKKYILKNKDTPIMTFLCIPVYGKIANEVFIKDYDIKKIEILNEELLPKSYPLAEKFNGAKVKEWIKRRKAPSNRKNIESILNYEVQTQGLDSKNFMNYIDISFGLSLNDSYWIVPDDRKEYLWREYNLYENRFSERLSLIAFGEKEMAGSIIEDIHTSPEYTTNGMLAKCWTNLDGELTLIKHTSEDRVEALAEYYLCQVAEVMDFEHIEYDIVEFHNKKVSACKIFTTEDEGYVPIYYFLTTKERAGSEEKLLKKVEGIIGREKIEDIMLFDSLIFNEDRHLGNYGMIVDNNTGVPLKSAPIFDNGNSLFMLLNEAEEGKPIHAKHRIGISFDTLSKIYVAKRHGKGLERLKNFSFRRHPKYNLPENLIKRAESFIRERAEVSLKHLEEKSI